jgi:hypothetical protein
MNKKDSKIIAETITNEELLDMFNNAKENITDWTKGVSWNILAKDFDMNHKYHILAKTNMVREFGEFLPDQLKPQKINKQSSNNPPVHQEPKFNG